jgi:NADPH:quinone reductase-like Zn-dependent oxidoreductase
MEVAGIVEQVGAGVSKFKVGDAVFGDTSDYGFGSFAEYMALHENALNLKPEKITFEEAVNIPHASMLALQGYQLVGGVHDGMDILINGGGGGVGAFALQIAKQHNVNVTGVDTGEKLSQMLKQGFDSVLDYKQVDFTEAEKQYDIIFDCRTSRTPSKHKKAMKENGRYVSIGGQSGKLINMLLFRKLHELGSNKKFYMVALKANQGMEAILDMYQKGQLTFQIDGPFSFEQAPEAIQRFGDGKHHGKIVIKVD